MRLTKEASEKRVAKVAVLIEEGYSVQQLADHFKLRKKSMVDFLKRHHLQTHGQRYYEENNEIQRIKNIRKNIRKALSGY